MFSSLASRELRWPSSGVSLLFTPVCCPHSGTPGRLWPTLPIHFYQHVRTLTHTHTHAARVYPCAPPGVTCLTQAGHCPRPTSLLHLSPFLPAEDGGSLQKLPVRADTRPFGASTLASQAGSELLLIAGKSLEFLPINQVLAILDFLGESELGSQKGITSRSYR